MTKPSVTMAADDPNSRSREPEKKKKRGKPTPNRSRSHSKPSKKCKTLHKHVRPWLAQISSSTCHRLPQVPCQLQARVQATAIDKAQALLATLTPNEAVTTSLLARKKKE
jgi:hypothetical protein